MILSKLLVALGVDASDYQKGLDDAEKKAGTSAKAIGSKLEGIGKSMMKTGAVMSAAVTGPLVALGMKTMDAASDLEESMNKVGVVFGNAAGRVLEFGSTAATALGMSKQQALEAAGTFGNLMTAMGLSRVEAAVLSEDMIGLAADLASFNNIDPTEALEKLRAGLVGEAEPLRSLGVNMSEAAVKAKAVEMGLAKAGETLTDSEKLFARYTIIMEQTSNAQGDFARTSDGLANSQRIMKAQIADLAATMGTQLLPYGLKIVQFVSDLVGKFQGLSPETQKIITIVGALAAAIGPVILVAGSLTTAIGGIVSAASALGPILAGVAAVITGPVGLAIAAIVAAVIAFKLAWDSNFLGIRDTLTAVWEGYLKPAFETVAGWLQVFIPQAIQVLTDAWNNILLPVLNAVWDFIQTYLAPLFEVLAKIVLVAVSKALEVLAGIWNKILYPALIIVWAALKDKLQPGFDAISTIVRDVLGPVLEWLGQNILARVESGFAAIGKAVKTVTALLQAFADWLSNIEIPTWLQGASPPPLANWLADIGEATEDLARTKLPELEVALQMRAPNMPALAGALAGGAGGGDTFIIHNHNPLAAALTNAMVEERRRARLNRSM